MLTIVLIIIGLLIFSIKKIEIEWKDKTYVYRNKIQPSIWPLKIELILSFDHHNMCNNHS